MNLGTLGEKTEPSKTAFVSLADGIHYTYADLQRISDMVAADLADEFEKGTKIALVGVNSGAYVATLLGVMKAGMVAVPVNPKLPPLRISDILADSGAQQVFADGELKASLSKTLPVNAFYTSGNRSFETVVPDDGAARADPVYVRFDGQAKRRCPLSPKPCLDSAGAGGNPVIAG